MFVTDLFVPQLKDRCTVLIIASLAFMSSDILSEGGETSRTPPPTHTHTHTGGIDSLGGGGATPAAYGNFQARGLIRAVAVGLHHTVTATPDLAASRPYTTAHSNPESFNSLSEARDRTCVLMSSSWVSHC